MLGAMILVADDERIARENLEYILKKDGYRVVLCENGRVALNRLEETEFDLVMTDLRMQPVDGAEVLRRTKEKHPNTEVIVITGYASVDSAVLSMRDGAFSYVSKPYKVDEVRAIVKQALEKRSLRREVHDLKRQIQHQKDMPVIIGNSRQIEALKKTVRQIAASDCTVLIYGETGTGKELVARTIHHQSLRADKRFLAINCGAFTDELLANELFGHEKEAFTGARGSKKGLLEVADGGTVFLDEIGDMPINMQVKLLRVLQEGRLIRVGGTEEIPVDIRIITATNKDLKREVANGSFRQDLFYRLNVISLEVPRLSDRRDDILLLALHFLSRFARAQKKEVGAIDDEVMEILLSYEFPGNVRELENFIERAVALSSGNTIRSEHLPEDIRNLAEHVKRGGPEFPTLEENERAYISKVLKQVNDNKTRAAQMLGIDRVSLWRKLKRYRME